MISIIMPTYNCALYLDRAISSVLRQTYKDWELIIINDGSIDNTDEIIKYYLTDKRIRYISQCNSGVSKSRNLGIDVSKGEFITFLDADDSYHNSFLQELYNAISTKEIYDISYSGFNYLSLDGICTKSVELDTNKNVFHSYLKLLYNQSHPFSICSMMFKKEFINVNNLKFDESKTHGEDTLFIISSLFLGNVVSTQNHLFNYISRSGSASNNKFGSAFIPVLESYKEAYNFILNREENLVDSRLLNELIV